MVFLKRKLISLMVLCCVTLHMGWATLILTDESSLAATPLASLHYLIPNTRVLITALYAVALGATFALFSRWPWIVWLLMPQQLMLMLSSAGATTAIYLAQYADGVVRPHSFIAADQLLMLLATFWHTIAIIAHARRVA